MKNLIECLGDIREYLEEACECSGKKSKLGKGARFKKAKLAVKGKQEEKTPKMPRPLKAKRAPKTRLGRSSSGPSSAEIKAGWTALMGGG